VDVDQSNDKPSYENAGINEEEDSVKGHFCVDIRIEAVGTLVRHIEQICYAANASKKTGDRTVNEMGK
jgi:hypothetical protein